MADRLVTFSKLTVGMTIRHANGTCYKIVKIKEKKDREGIMRHRVWARWRNGHIGRFGKEVVKLTPAHIVGFLRYVARTHRARREVQADGEAGDPGVGQADEG